MPHALDDYAHRVVAGELPAGKYHRLACARHLRDRAREHTAVFPYRFDLELAARFFRFAAKLKHYKGRQWAGKLVELSDCQKFRLGSLFGWVHTETGLRRFRTAYNELPRKQGKSLESAIVIIYVTFFDGEDGAEGYCTATKRDQAKIVFSDAKKLVQSNAGLKHRIAIHAWNLSEPNSSSKLEPLSADHDSMDGLNPHGLIIDEFHAHKDRGVIDVLETAMGARLQPVNFQVTTAGDDELSPCGEQHHYACQILEQALDDETFFAFIAHADEARIEHVSSLFALREMVRLCSCKSESVAHRSAILDATLSGRTFVTDSISSAIRSGSSSRTPTTTTDASEGCEIGRSPTRNASGKTNAAGEPRTLISSVPPAAGQTLSPNSDSRSATTAGFLKSKADAAGSAVNCAPSTPSTTAMKPGTFAGCSASSAIPASAISEMVRREFSAHSPTCVVSTTSRLNESGDGLIVSYEGDDPFDEATWQKANPHYGVSVNPADMRALATKAQHMPSAIAAFKQKRLNLWVNATAPWLSLENWKAGQGQWIPAALIGSPCWVGVDLASKTDLAAVVAIFPPTPNDNRWRLLPWFFTPADGLAERELQARAPYRRWVDEGYLRATLGNRIDHAVIRQVILDEIHPRYPIQLLGFDPWNVGNLARELQDAIGEERIVEIPQTMAQLSEPSKEFEAEVGAAHMDAAGHPVMRWMIANVIVDRDSKDNIFPTKRKSRGRIDGVVAAIMGLKLARLGDAVDDASKDFEARGLYL